MRSLDDILVGFFIFFAIDRAIRLVSNSIVAPWAERKGSGPAAAENWKLAAEFSMLVIACIIVLKSRGIIMRLNKA
jgi:hypothetical protein